MVKPFIGVSKLSGAEPKRKFNMNKTDIKQYVGKMFSMPTMLFASPRVQGAQPMATGGRFFSWRAVREETMVGNTTIVTSSITVALTGLLSGTLIATAVDVFYPNGNLLVSISGTFSGTVSGQSGTAEISATGGPITRGNGSGALRWVIGQGTLGLAGLNGQGSFKHPSFGSPIEQCPDDMVTGDYRAQLQFAD
jgi:hypothetical protein